MSKIYDLIIIGGGPAGVGAAVYAGRKKMDTLMIAESFGGQSIVSDKIENWIGDVSISGFELAQKLEAHARAQEDVEIRQGEKVKSIRVSECGFLATTDKDEYYSRAVVITSGGRHRTLNIPGEKEFTGRGVAYCSTCDAPFYKDKTVVVVGGGNSGLEAVIDLKPYAKKIYMLLNTDKPTGDPKTFEEVKKIHHFELVCCSSIEEITGKGKLEGIKYRDVNNNEIKEIETDGVFVEIGMVPNSEFVKDLVELNEHGEIKIDYKTAQTSHEGVFAAGDVTAELFKQNNIAVGDAVRAALSAYYYVMEVKKDKSKMADCELTKGLRKK